MGRYILRRLIYAIPVLLISSVLVFIVVHLLHFTTETVDPGGWRGMTDSHGNRDVYGNIVASFQIWWVALFYVVGTAIGGLAAPALFGALLDTGRKEPLVLGYLIGAGLMLAAAAVELVLGVATERKSLEDVAAPLSSERPTPEGPRAVPLPRAAAGAGAGS